MMFSVAIRIQVVGVDTIDVIDAIQENRVQQMSQDPMRKTVDVDELLGEQNAFVD